MAEGRAWQGQSALMTCSLVFHEPYLENEAPDKEKLRNVKWLCF
jgi:hypothetical protein